MNSDFANYTTSTAFNLQLSKVMVKYLVLMTRGEQVMLSTFLTTEQSLRRRGLVKRVPFDADYLKDGHDMSKPVLTDEGKLVVELLKYAGLYDAVLSEFNLRDESVA